MAVVETTLVVNDECTHVFILTIRVYSFYYNTRVNAIPYLVKLMVCISYFLIFK